MDEQDILWERYGLVLERIRQIPEEHFGKEEVEGYFKSCAQFLLLIDDTLRFLAGGGYEKATLEELKERNYALYADILPGHYEESYGNPSFAVRKLGEELGGILSFLYAELRSLIGFAHEDRLEDVVIRMELFVEVYGAFSYAAGEDGTLPSGEEIRGILYWFAFDYADVAAERRIREQVCAEGSRSEEGTSVSNVHIGRIMNSELSDVRTLYGYGEYVSESELEMAKFLSTLPEETIYLMADTFTEGYRIGFEVTGKDLSRKRTVGLYYRLGFERMMRRAIENFEKMGLKALTFRRAYSVLDNRGLGISGFCGAVPNRQYDYDHKDDSALFLDRNYVNRKLDVTRTAYEKYKDEAGSYGGPAAVVTFGEADFQPISKSEALRLSQEQEHLWVEYRSLAGRLQRAYIPEEERSFTMIAFPVPEIGPVFQELFRETIRINTLDYMRYRNVQQILINALDEAEYCEVRGCNGNRTNLKIQLYPLSHPEKETKFENCVADVNIPVGEVFTSPVLEGTEGLLHVSRVFLNGLEYRDLAITFEEGMICEYSCGNFDGEEENQNFVRENILCHHETLPMGEFAIGTNTTAYVTARRLAVEAKLPILIAEKMGPHFAVGDTCYAHVEDVSVYNPDGKEIVARTNGVSELRKTKPEEAYFNCHTDITIPYDELGELTAVRKDGSRIMIIQNGRFVLPGCEELNEAFEKI